MALPQENTYTIEDIYSLPEGTRAELIDGQIYYMAPPNRIHQEIVHFLDRTIGNYIVQKEGSCKIYPAPFAVLLNKDDRNYVEPDLSVICDLSKLNDKGCQGAPDWIIEIVSPGNPEHDYITKLEKYKTAGVREYWIVDPKAKSVTVYFFEGDIWAKSYTFSNTVPVNIYDDLTIDFTQLKL
ncbi:MAG TPA: Uma2 family endonuclease [Candidatus Limivivens intestinipullorum]|uniref:Uma2 family endonuclease n=1 Tax=Candidatus Limivivens intestinipullorum TaxID=2840858 RepID=A0A9D1JKN2_9FIRM|nr:Uma2 family endonuclease [Candidatus Limivivens intestinipullorum]